MVDTYKVRGKDSEAQADKFKVVNWLNPASALRSDRASHCDRYKEVRLVNPDNGPISF